MGKQREDLNENVDAFLSLGVGEAATFPLEKYNTIRMLRYTNPKILKARAEGREYKVTADITRRCVVVARKR